MANVGYDELLFERVKQLREIDDRLERIFRTGGEMSAKVAHELIVLRRDVADMIRQAEAEHAAF
jgi:hypothetical protein